MLQVERILIIGTGLIGSSIGMGLKQAGFRGQIVGAGGRQGAVGRALAAGAIDRVAADLTVELRGCQLAVISVPLSGFETIFRQVAHGDHDDLIITDVGSTKLSVLEAARKWLPGPQRFVGGHPMAGSEQQGPEAARCDLFVGKPCILTPESDTDSSALRLTESLWKMLGMSVIQMSAREHDKQTAIISHLPHAVAVLLVQVVSAAGGWDIASTGFCDTTRLASSNPPMRADIMMANRSQILKALDAFGVQLDVVREVLEKEDESALVDLLQRSKEARDQWIKNRS